MTSKQSKPKSNNENTKPMKNPLLPQNIATLMKGFGPYKTNMLGMMGIYMLVMLTACQPKPDVSQDSGSSKSSSPVDLIVAKTVQLKTPQSESCDESGCTRYQFQSVETNLAWIDGYFKDRIQKIEPLAFEPAKKAAVKSLDDKQRNESSIVVRYVGQNQQLATFEMLTYGYSAGAAHGMYHKEYVNFDLKSQKRIALQDLIAPGAETKLINTLYENNRTWLDAHSVEQAKLQLSDNFYYGANGIVFVYPLYELASYAEGMSELNLPYVLVKDLIKPEYLPNLPQYAER